MRARVHAYLDGELPRTALSAEELCELEEMERALGTLRRSITDQPVPDLSERVLASLPVLPPEPTALERAYASLRAALRWSWKPRALIVRPVHAFAVVMLLAFGIWSIPTAGPEAPQLAVAPSEPPQASRSEAVFVQFRLDVPQAARVQLAGSFTEWSPQHELQETAPGVWTALVRLQPGVHEYLFVVDGEQWVPDPVAPTTPDSFGGTNSRLFLAAPPAEA